MDVVDSNYDVCLSPVALLAWGASVPESAGFFASCAIESRYVIQRFLLSRLLIFALQRCEWLAWVVRGRLATDFRLRFSQSGVIASQNAADRVIDSGCSDRRERIGLGLGLVSDCHELRRPHLVVVADRNVATGDEPCNVERVRHDRNAPLFADREIAGRLRVPSDGAREILVGPEHSGSDSRSRLAVGRLGVFDQSAEVGDRLTAATCLSLSLSTSLLVSLRVGVSARLAAGRHIFDVTLVAGHCSALGGPAVLSYERVDHGLAQQTEN